MSSDEERLDPDRLVAAGWTRDDTPPPDLWPRIEAAAAARRRPALRWIPRLAATFIGGLSLSAALGLAGSTERPDPIAVALRHIRQEFAIGGRASAGRAELPFEEEFVQWLGGLTR